MNQQRSAVAVAAGLSLMGYAAAQQSQYQVGAWVDVLSRMELVVPADSTRPGYTLVADHDPDYAGPLRDDYFMITIPETGGPRCVRGRVHYIHKVDRNPAVNGRPNYTMNPTAGGRRLLAAHGTDETTYRGTR